ncbi:hypothetical protein [Microbulbifer sp. VAAF005]|uniref:hypothetical protein n=1 Tax=Microbulbifer sp. VAAF005 TaxID=3034230 RepID=UPI0024ADCFA9|nr:hypothetical protein [Microbulbifer sp. VAAF005]WHI46789.1 hypothetical protein P0078_24345 [Microbulbifer sp. VAAF005]
MNFWKYTTGLAALIFCGTSVVFTVGLWISIPSAEGQPLVWGLTAGGIVAGLTATALELCKFSFAPLGLWLRSKGRPIGNVLLTLWPFLVLISIAATVGFLESHTAEQKQLNTRNSLEYQTMQQQLSSLEQQINNLNGIIATDAANNYRKRAIKTAEQLENLEQRRSEAIAQLKAIQGSGSDSAQAAFSGLALLTHTDPQKLQYSAFLALAVITDLVGLVALLAFNSALTVVSDDADKPETSTEDQQSDPNDCEISTESATACDNGLNEMQKSLAERIAAGEFGPKPVLRNINREVKGGNNVVQPVFEYLEKQGVLERAGRGFALITN